MIIQRPAVEGASVGEGEWVGEEDGGGGMEDVVSVSVKSLNLVAIIA